MREISGIGQSLERSLLGHPGASPVERFSILQQERSYIRDVIYPQPKPSAIETPSVFLDLPYTRDVIHPQPKPSHIETPIVLLEPSYIRDVIYPQPKPSMVEECTVWEPGVPVGRYPVEVHVGLERASGSVVRDRYHEVAGHLVDAGSFVADAIGLPAKVGEVAVHLVDKFGLPAQLGEFAGYLTQAKLGIMFSTMMAQGDATGYTGQAEIVEVEATKAAVEFNLERLEGDARELSRVISSAKPGDRSLASKLQALSRIVSTIASLKKVHKGLGVERTKALHGTVYIGGHDGKNRK